MFKFVLLFCLCMTSICTDAHRKAGAQLPIGTDLGTLLDEANFIYPFIIFKK